MRGKPNTEIQEIRNDLYRIYLTRDGEEVSGTRIELTDRDTAYKVYLELEIAIALGITYGTALLAPSSSD